ncbi:MAG: hypothetical protein ABL933_06640 [Methyloglobulus sp.]|nr:hypothetical protein [Methyloglobulus sp.]
MASEIAIMHILNGEHYSGLERVVDQLSELAPEYGYRLHLVFLKPLTMRLRMKSTQVTIYECPMRNKLDVFASAKKISAIAKDADCRLIHSHCVRSTLVASRVKKQTGLP